MPGDFKPGATRKRIIAYLSAILLASWIGLFSLSLFGFGVDARGGILSFTIRHGAFWGGIHDRSWPSIAPSCIAHWSYGPIWEAHKEFLNPVRNCILPTFEKEEWPIFTSDGPYVNYFASLPLWIVILANGLTTWVLIKRRRGQPSHARCKCGYDLTGNLSGVCPECGAMVRLDLAESYWKSA